MTSLDNTFWQKAYHTGNFSMYYNRNVFHAMRIWKVQQTWRRRTRFWHWINQASRFLKHKRKRKGVMVMRGQYSILLLRNKNRKIFTKSSNLSNGSQRDEAFCNSKLLFVTPLNWWLSVNYNFDFYTMQIICLVSSPSKNHAVLVNHPWEVSRIRKYKWKCINNRPFVTC